MTFSGEDFMKNTDNKTDKPVFSKDSNCIQPGLSPEQQHLCKLMASARWQALRLHKLFGNAVPVSHDGKVVWIQPEDIEIPEEEMAKPLRLPAIY